MQKLLMPAADMLVRLIDVPASLSGESRDAQLEGLRKQYASASTLLGLKRLACKSHQFMGGSDFWVGREEDAPLPGLNFSVEWERQPESAEESLRSDVVKWTLTDAGELWVSWLTFVYGVDGIPLSDAGVQLHVTRAGDDWSVRIVESRWVTPQVVTGLQGVLWRLSPSLTFSSDHLAALQPCMGAALETFVRLIDVPQALSSLCRDDQLAALRTQFGNAHSFLALEALARRDALFLEHGLFFAGFDDESGDQHSIDFEDQLGLLLDVDVWWTIESTGRLELTASLDDVSFLTVLVTPSGGDWTVEVKSSRTPCWPEIQQINELLKRIDPGLSLTQDQLAQCAFSG